MSLILRNIPLSRGLALALGLLLSLVASAQRRAEGIAELLGWQPGDTAVCVPAHARQLPAYALASIPGLRSVTFAPGSQCRIIAAYAFAGCDSLREVRFPSSVVSIGEGAFRECVSLRRVNIPEAVRVIPKECFLRCESLDSILLSPRLVEIKGFAFAQCASLSEIKIPESVGDDARSATRYRGVDLRRLPLAERDHRAGHVRPADRMRQLAGLP